MALNCLFAALYAALSILLSGAAVFAGQVLVKQPSVSFCKFPARAGQPPAAGGTTLPRSRDDNVALFCENLRRYAAGEALQGLVDRSQGY